MRAVLLGSGGWIPTARRETCCALVRDERSALLIDAGTGVRRLLDDPELLSGVESLDIVLTHFHLDHVVGLTYLPALTGIAKAVLWAPGRLAYGAPSRIILEKLLGDPFFAAPVETFAADVREIRAGTSEISQFSVSTRVQLGHAHPTLALRLGDALTYCTDTRADPQNASFASGSRVLLHEAWHVDPALAGDGHTTAAAAGRLAAEARVRSLVLIHINPVSCDDDDLLAEARAIFPTAQVGRDLMWVV